MNKMAINICDRFLSQLFRCSCAFTTSDRLAGWSFYFCFFSLGKNALFGHLFVTKDRPLSNTLENLRRKPESGSWWSGSFKILTQVFYTVCQNQIEWACCMMIIKVIYSAYKHFPSWGAKILVWMGRIYEIWIILRMKVRIYQRRS